RPHAGQGAADPVALATPAARPARRGRLRDAEGGERDEHAARGDVASDEQSEGLRARAVAGILLVKGAVEPPAEPAPGNRPRRAEPRRELLLVAVGCRRVADLVGH